MKILYAASEAAPFAKSGGLADVAGALPKALVRDGIDARVVMPLYGDLKFKDTLTYVTNFSVPVGWRSQYCGLFKAERDGVVFYFIDNEYYFKRSGLYGFYDDGERFAFFSRAILEMLFYTDFEPDIINCNDWQTALTPVYLNLYYRHLDKFSRIKTVFTIHNIAYQGKYGLDILEDTCGIGARDAHVVEYDGCANFMKGAIECADKVTTVSPTYAQEILDPWFSHGLDGLLRQKQYKLCGILNGIDVDVFNPATDPDIAKNYDAETFQEGKAVCKEALQDEFGLHVSDIPREGYARTEKRIVEELDALGKPYIILLNSTHPDAPETKQLAEGMTRDYDHTVLPVSCVDLDAEALGSILRQVLYEFPVRELDFALPRWVTMLENGHWLQTQVYDAAMQLAEKVSRMKDVPAGTDAPALECDAVQRSSISGIDLANGSVRITVELKPEIFYQVLSEQTGLAIGDEAGLMPCIMELARAKREYEKVRSALEQVEATGYGIVMPSVSELKLEQPQIVRQGASYGVRLEACAPSIQMLKATIHTELSPIVGTEKQSEELARSLLAGFEDDPEKLWESNIFGKSLHELVNEGLQSKLLHMPQEARTRLQETLERVINEGCTGLICILI